MIKAIQIHAADPVAIALVPLRQGDRVSLPGGDIELSDAIPQGHKFALRDIPAGDAVLRYGCPIGVATRAIGKGQWVHSHNLASGLREKAAYCYQPETVGRQNPKPAPDAAATFRGYRRADGKVGIRNEIWLINTVGCINKQTEKLAALARQKFAAEIAGGRIDGIYAFSHPYGCSQLGPDLRNTQKILAGLVNHPHAAAVLVAGLGCENNRMADFQPIIGPQDPGRIQFLNFQDVTDEIETGLERIAALAPYAMRFQRQTFTAGELIIGLKCGGSDGLSGITANPLLGRISDRLIAAGGSAVLSETPEMFGAETILMNRAKDRAVFEQIAAMIQDFKDYFIRNGCAVYENPAPGNREGGITTLEEKSLGCIQKGGASPVTAVLEYGGRIATKGLNLLDSPGNDMVSTTALTAAGANLILFTTGRGTPLGAPVPTVKIATNSAIFARKRGWFDFDAGRLLSGTGMAELSDELFALILAVAAKQVLTQNESNDFRDIAICKTGVTL